MQTPAKKLQSYNVRLQGIERTIVVVATSPANAYAKACAKVNFPPNRRPLSESIAVTSTPVGTTIR